MYRSKKTINLVWRPFYIPVRHKTFLLVKLLWGILDRAKNAEPVLLCILSENTHIQT